MRNDDFRATAEDRAARRSARFYYLRASEQCGAAGQTEIKLRAPRDLRAEISTACTDCFSAAAEDNPRPFISRATGKDENLAAAVDSNRALRVATAYDIEGTARQNNIIVDVIGGGGAARLATRNYDGDGHAWSSHPRLVSNSFVG